MARIKKLTGYTLQEIKTMSNIEFYRNIVPLLTKGTINKQQYDFLEKARIPDKTTRDAIEIFGGTVLR